MNLETPDNTGTTPLWIASSEGHLDVVKFLHSCGVNSDKPDDYGSTPLWIASS